MLQSLLEYPISVHGRAFRHLMLKTSKCLISSQCTQPHNYCHYYQELYYKSTLWTLNCYYHNIITIFCTVFTASGLEQRESDGALNHQDLGKWNSIAMDNAGTNPSRVSQCSIDATSV